MTIDYKQIIDGLKWAPSPEEVQLRAELSGALKNTDLERYFEISKRLEPIKTEPPLRQLGLEHPVFYAFQARAAWEMLLLAEITGEKLKEEYNLHPAGQDGIGLDWHKLNNRIWVPAQYLEWSTYPKTGCSIFSHDEFNCARTSAPEDEHLYQ